MFALLLILNEMIDLEKIKKDTEANTVILIDDRGQVLNSTDEKYVANFALMTEASFSMCNDLLKELTNKNLEQLIAKSEEDYLIVNKLDSKSILLITCNNISKFGLLMKYMNTLKSNLI